MFESIFKMTNSSEREIKQKMSLHQYTMKVRKVYRSYWILRFFLFRDLFESLFNTCSDFQSEKVVQIQRDETTGT